VPFNSNFSLGLSSGDQLLILSGLASSIFIPAQINYFLPEVVVYGLRFTRQPIVLRC
jgi:hypothetical protein